MSRHLFALAYTVTGLAVSLTAQSLKDDMTLYIDGESMTAKPPVEYISQSIRQRPGKFGKALLIERRTLNYAVPEDFVLGDGAAVKGKGNLISLPQNGFAAIPQTGLKENASNILSFRYKGEGKITVELAENGMEVPLTTLHAHETYQDAAIRFFPKSDAASLKIRSEKPALLDNVMVDRNIDFPNSYHAPGRIRGVDVIHVNPDGVFNPASGAISFWLKAPWFRPGGQGSGLAVMDVLTQLKQTSRFGDNFAKVISVWGSKDVHGVFDPYMLDSNIGEKTSARASFRLSEIPGMPSDGWVHVAVCWNLKDGILTDTITLNGKQTFSRSERFVPFKKFERIEIGYSGGSYTNGMLDDFAMFSRPLTQKEIKAIVTSGKPLSQMGD